jgi:hypothetical protein
MTIKAVVLSVTKPKVASVQGQYYVQVLWAERKRGLVYRKKHWVFSQYLPAIGSEIMVTIL